MIAVERIRGGDRHTGHRPPGQPAVRAMVRIDRYRGRPPGAVLAELFETDEPRAGRVLGVRPVISCRGREIRRGGTARRRRRVRQDSRVWGEDARLLSALSRDACSARPGCPRGASARSISCCTQASATRVPMAGPGAYRDAQDGHRRRPRERGDQRHHQWCAVRSARVGARIVACRSGSRRIAALHEAGATHVLDNIAALPGLDGQEREFDQQLAGRGDLHLLPCRNCLRSKRSQSSLRGCASGNVISRAEAACSPCLRRSTRR